jgi:hypothetical protein
MELYRAVPASGFDPAKRHERFVGSVRLPSNVPYVVDNLWEWLRPGDMPSRRHAIYASPTPALALANASAGTGEFVACRVIVDRSQINIAQLKVEDARYHADIKAVSRLVSEFNKKFVDAPSHSRGHIGALFYPGTTAGLIEDVRMESSVVANFCALAKERMTFWQDASREIQDHSGELFFELLSDEAHYTLEPV